MELKPGETLAFDAPEAAFRDYLPGQSPYIHRWLELNGKAIPDGAHDDTPPSAGAEAALRRLIDAALGDDGAGPRGGDAAATAAP